MNKCVRTVVLTLVMSQFLLTQTTNTHVSAPGTLGSVLEDGTPVKIRIARTVSSADAHVGDTIDFEVLEEVRVGPLLLIPKGGVAWGTITQAESKRRMARGGKLDMNIDSVRLADGEKVALRAVKEVKGGGHTGAMTGAMVGTAIVFFPAAPLFLFMHGKDITIPKGTEVTAYVNGNFPVEAAKFQGATASVQAAASQASSAVSGATLDISSTPAGADIELDGNFIGNTPSSLGVVGGEHIVKISKSGYMAWQRKIITSTGSVRLTADLEISSPVAAPSPSPVRAESESNRTSRELIKTAAPAAPMALTPSSASEKSPTPIPAIQETHSTVRAGQGSISVTSDPDGAEIFVDSVGHGKAPSVFKLPAGDHSVQIVMSGYQDWTSHVKVDAESVVNVTATLKK